MPRLPSPILLAPLLLGLMLARTALAFDITSVTVARTEGGLLSVTTHLQDPIETRVQHSLERGMPATLLLHAELWRRRSGWFDRMESSSDATVRLRHDVWHDEWTLERAGAATIRASSVDSLERALSRPLVIDLAGFDHVPPDSRCYVVVTATLKPLSVEDAEEVEGWVSGEVRSQGRFGIITQLPRSLFDAVRNFTGFGDSHDQAQTPEFDPADLPVLKRGRE